MNLIYLCAAHSYFFAIYHLGFWREYKWGRELAKLDAPNRAIVQILNLRLIYVFMAVGVLCIAYPEDLRATPFGRAFLVGMGCFWLGRFVEQMIFLRANRKTLHVQSALFILGAGLFFASAIL